MAQDSWPSPSHNSRAVTDAEYEWIANRFSDDGVYGDTSSSPVITAGAGLTVLVKAGFHGALRGHSWYSGATDDTLTIGANSSGSTRIDRVVLKLDRSAWTVRAVVKAGTPGSGAPALQQDAGDSGVYEIRLADVTVPNAATSVTVSNCPKYVGSRVQVQKSTAPSPTRKLGEITYYSDTGAYVGYNGTTDVPMYSDTGTLAVSQGYTDVWDVVGPMEGRKKNGIVCVQVNLRRKSSTLQSSDADGSWIATVPTALIPNRVEYFACQITGGNPCRLEVRTDGQIWLIWQRDDVGVGRFVRNTMTWFKD